MRYQAALHSDRGCCIAGRAAMQASCLTAERKTQARPRPDPVGLHAATFQLEHIFRRTRRSPRNKGPRRGFFNSRDEPALVIEKQHVERDQRVLHPEAADSHAVKDEQHAGIRIHGLDMHQAVGMLARRCCKLHPVCQQGAVTAVQGQGGCGEVRPVPTGAQRAGGSPRNYPEQPETGEKSREVEPCPSRQGDSRWQGSRPARGSAP